MLFQLFLLLRYKMLIFAVTSYVKYLNGSKDNTKCIQISLAFTFDPFTLFLSFIIDKH